LTFTVANAFAWWIRELPDQIALEVDGDPVTYRELDVWTRRVAADLAERGARPGDRIAIMAANSMEFAALMIGAMRAGIISAPVNFRSKPRELADFRTLIEPAIVFADSERVEAASDAFGEAIDLAQIAALRDGDHVDLAYEIDSDDPLFVIGTSGSTGKPKSTIYSHRTVMTWAAEFALMEPGCGKGGSFLSLGPFSAASGTLHLFELIAIGNTVFIETQFDAARALRLLEQRRISTFIGVPLFFERIAAEPDFASADLSALKFAQTAGARISPDLLAAWRAKNVILRQAYGCTEAGGAWAARDDTAIDEPHKAGHGGIFSQFAISDGKGGFAAPETEGEILVRSACVTPGYWNQPDATAETIRNGWLHTGDLGKLDATGNLTFVDRLKDIIISGGLNVSAMEVEQTIGQLPGVKEVAVIAFDDPRYGEAPLAIIYGGRNAPSADGVIAHCSERLAGYKIPRYVTYSNAPLPRLVVGKISKVDLRREYREKALEPVR